ncbi:regulatory protein RecX [Siccibacter turicensis]|uniref:regulatory protein RecX n=1 Tax=Siccibacter turicensis TaxID=357233 RepID=UPI0023F4A0C0|nr:regulatory protein RecX [Siccibacter turicensis]
MSDSSSPRRSPYARLFDRATRVLAMRDHSEQELRKKLSTVYPGQKDEPPAPEDIEKVIASCLEQHWLDDARFARQFIASRARKGYGSRRIRQELQQKGISRELCDAAMAECEVGWTQAAWDQATKKYGEPLPTLFAEKAKVQRFLLYRGFLMEDIQEIYRNFAD